MSTILDNRLTPDFVIDESGQITWKEVLVDHDADKFYRGKQLTHAEFNELFHQHASAENYTADSVKQFFEKKLNVAINRQMSSTLHLIPSYVKIFTSQDWGSPDAEGYYTITIPSSEHGFAINDDYDPTERSNIAAFMYLLDASNEFYAVDNVNIDTNNTVTIYTDDNTLNGFVVIRTNDTAYGLSTVHFTTDQIDDLAQVAITNNYEDLSNKPTARFVDIEDDIAKIKNGTTKVPSATTADSALAIPRAGRINGINVSAIFENEGSRVVKEATNATNATAIQNINLSADTPAQFGGYVIPKKKLLFDNNGVDVLSLDLDVEIGDIIEIEYTSNKGYVYTSNTRTYHTQNKNYIKVKCEAIGVTASGSYDFSFSIPTFETVYNSSGDGTINLSSYPMTLRYDASSQKFSLINGGYVNNGMVYTTKIYKVYKIIE